MHISFRARWVVLSFISTALFLIWGLSPIYTYHPTAHAAFPHILPFSARLTSPSSSTPVPNGTYSITFRIYDGAEGGSPLWSETLAIPVTEGLVTTNLGEKVSLPSSLTFNSGTHYLGVSVGSDPEMTPRRAITAVPLALNAASVDGATPGTSAGNILQLDSEGGFSLAGPILTTSTLQGGSTTISGTLHTAGATTLGATLQVASSGSIGGALSIGEDLTVQGAASIGGNLSLAGNLIPTTSGSFDLGSSPLPPAPLT